MIQNMKGGIMLKEKTTYSSWCECCEHYTVKDELIDNWCYDCTERH